MDEVEHAQQAGARVPHSKVHAGVARHAAAQCGNEWVCLQRLQLAFEEAVTGRALALALLFSKLFRCRDDVRRMPYRQKSDASPLRLPLPNFPGAATVDLL